MSKSQRLGALVYPVRRWLRNWVDTYRVAWANPGCYLDFPIQWDFDDLSAIRLAPNVRLGAFSEIVVRKKSPGSPIAGGLTVGDRSAVGVHANIRAEGGVVVIGRQCLIAQGVSLVAANHTIGTTAPYQDLPIDAGRTGVTLEDNVWIAAHATILPGCVIGRNSIIGTGSVVTHSVPPNEIWVGVPARKLRPVGSVREP